MPMAIGSWSKKVVATRIVAADGSGDYTSIQPAIDSLPAGGGVVYIKEGTYTITTAITMGDNNIALIGAGKSTKIATTADIDMISATSKSGLLIDSVYLYGAGSGNGSNRGVLFDDVSDSIIRSCWIENCGDMGIYASGGSTGLVITGNIITSNYSIGVFLESSYYSTFSFNVIESSAHQGIAIAYSIEDVVVGNTIKSNTRSGLWIDTSLTITVTGNIIASNGRNGVLITDSEDNSIVANIITNNDSGNTATYDGISLSGDSNDNIIVGNRIKDNDNYEINVAAGTCNNNFITGNSIEGTDHEGDINDEGTNTGINHGGGLACRYDSNAYNCSTYIE